MTSPTFHSLAQVGPAVATPTASSFLVVSMIVLSLTLATLLLAAIRQVSPGSFRRSALAVLAWLAGTGAMATAGVLSFDTRPPTMPLLLVVLAACTILFARSALGHRLATGVPLAVLVGYQLFRVPVELWLHRGWTEGVFPVQMTYAGLNFDIASGLSAAAVGVLVWRGIGGRRLVLAWNVVGLGLLLTIVGIALLSAPTPFRHFQEGPSSDWVTGFPGIWLPAVLVQAAFFGHLLVFRRLLGKTPA